MAKLTIYLPDDLADRVRASGISVSPVCQRALQKEIDSMEAAKSLKSREERIAVEVRGPAEAPVEKAFYGTWLVTPDPDETRTSESGWDAGSYWGVALTRKGQIAVYVAHVNERWPSELSIYSDIDEAGKKHPRDIIAMAAAELGQSRTIELDI